MINNVFACPQCGYEIPINEAITHQMREELEKEATAKVSRQQKELSKREGQLAAAEKELQREKGKLSEQVAKMLQSERPKLEKEVRKKVEEKLALELEDLKSEAAEKTQQLEEMRKKELKLRRDQRQLEDEKASLELELERKLAAEKKKLGDSLRESIAEEYRLKERQYKDKIDGLTARIGELKQKAEQGSQQAQGETLERQLEDGLKTCFSFDLIEPVGNGKKGSDIVQLVQDGTGRECGTIIWEAKRTKNWSDKWVGKLKSDQREAGADIAVIVSTILPKDVRGFDLVNGVWITDYGSFKALATALRAHLIELSRARQAEVGKREKMAILYDYLSSQGFRQRVEALVEAFATLQNDLEKEKRAMNKIWKQREMQLQIVSDSTVSMLGEMHGIIGASMPEIEGLELRAIACINDTDSQIEEGELVT